MMRILAVPAVAAALLALALLVRAPRPAPAVRVSEPAPRTVPAPETVVQSRINPTQEEIASPPVTREMDALCQALTTLRSRMRPHAGGRPYTPEGFAEVMALEREVEALGKVLARAVAASPDGGQGTIDRLLGIDSEEDALRIARMIATAVGECPRGRLAGALANAGPRRERQVALVVLSADSTPPSLLSILHAAQADDDASIRTAAFREAHSRAVRCPEQAPLIREVAATRAACDPDETARCAAEAASHTPSGVAGRIQQAARRAR